MVKKENKKQMYILLRNSGQVDGALNQSINPSAPFIHENTGCLTKIKGMRPADKLSRAVIS